MMTRSLGGKLPKTRFSKKPIIAYGQICVVSGLIANSSEPTVRMTQMILSACSPNLAKQVNSADERVKPRIYLKA